MRKLALVLLSAIYLFAGDITIDELLAKAKKENKVGVVFIERDNCPWCDRMKYKTFTNRHVEKKMSEELVYGKFNNKDDSLPQHLRARNAPTTHFVNGDGEILLSVVGYEPAGPFLKKVEEAQKKLNK